MAALAASTWSSYGSHARAYLTFCKGYGIIHPFPFTEPNICAFITFYFFTGKSWSTLKQAMASLRNLARISGDPCTVFSSPRIAMLRRGYKRSSKTKHRKPRVPITIWVLAALLQLIHSPQDGVFFTIACVGVFGLLRGGELTAKGPSYPTLTRSQITWYEDYFTIFLPESKTDVDRNGVLITIYKVTGSLCPYTRLWKLWNEAPSKHPHAPVFQDQFGRAITYTAMLQWLKSFLPRIGIPFDQVGVHSLRIGGATTLALLGVPAHIIKVLGRWVSLSYQVYTRTASQLQHTAALMAKACSQPHTFFGGLSLNQAILISDDSLSEITPLVQFRHH
jgi:hypothetical protein